MPSGIPHEEDAHIQKLPLAAARNTMKSMVKINPKGLVSLKSSLRGVRFSNPWSGYPCIVCI